MKKLILEQVLIQNYNPKTDRMDEEDKYKVIKIINSIDPKIGTVLHKDIVHHYCEDVSWNIEITGSK